MSEPNDTDILMNGEEWFAKNRGILINVTLVILIGVVGWNWIENKSSASSIEALIARIWLTLLVFWVVCIPSIRENRLPREP